MTVIKVPDFPIPGQYDTCWKQCTPAICRKVPKLLPRVMERCTYKRGHDGGHSWEDDDTRSQTQAS